MAFFEVTGSLRKFDDIYYTIERIVYSTEKLRGFTSDEIYENLRDKSFFRDAKDLHQYLIENGGKYRIRMVEGGWERYW